MSIDTLETIETDRLDRVQGSMGADARWIMMHESGGNPRAQNSHSTAYGAFQMLKATRKQYMGANWQSSDLNQQYAGATRYVQDRYGSWAGARRFWQNHHWY